MPLELLPQNILARILDLLPQQDLLSLAQTNYQFYQPCCRKLYKRLTVRIEPVLQSTCHRQNDFIDATRTVICGFSNAKLAPGHHYRMIDARLRTLVESITVNPELATYISELNVTTDLQDEAVIESLQLLIDIVQKIDPQIGTSSKPSFRKLYVKLENVRTRLAVDFAKWNSIVVDNYTQLAAAVNAKEVVFALASELAKKTPWTDKIGLVLAQLESIIIEDASTPRSLAQMAASTGTVFAPKHVSVVHYHDIDGNKTPTLNIKWYNVQSAQLILGCDNKACNQDCLSEFLGLIPPTAPISSIAIRQLNKQKHTYVHKFCENFDLITFSFLRQFSRLWYVSIRHSPPENGILEDGLEGNYLRRRKLFTETLPDAIRHVKKGNASTVFAVHPIIVFPNLLHLFACYEQAMNNLLWNGCKCEHCTPTLELLDEFLMLHQYYNSQLGRLKDLTTSQLMSAIAGKLSERMNPGGTDLDIDNFPLCKIEWDLHTVPGWGPFRCLGHHVYEGAEYDEDEVESKHQVECKFKNSNILPLSAIAKSISHYWENVVRRMIFLNRGDAEDIEIGKADELNDGGTDYGGAPVLGKIGLNGVVFNLGKELNGTNFSQNIYDT